MKLRIPNFDTLSTLLDRLSIENVKLAHFENAIEHDDLNEKQIEEFKNKIKTQTLIITELKKETTEFMKEAFVGGGYEYYKEERTFN